VFDLGRSEAQSDPTLDREFLVAPVVVARGRGPVVMRVVHFDHELSARPVEVDLVPEHGHVDPRSR
jgi:hypothetical protein